MRTRRRPILFGGSIYPEMAAIRGDQHHQRRSPPRLYAPNDQGDRAATENATTPLDLNAASVHPIVTIPWALAIARRATPPRLGPRPSHLVPSVGQPAPRRTSLFPCRRAMPGDRRHRGFHPAEALPRERTGHHRPGLPRDGTSCFHHADHRPATQPSWLEAGRSADRNDGDDRAATGRATIPLDLNAASVHPIVTIPWALAIARWATPPRLASRPSHLAPSVGQPRRDGRFRFHAAERCPATGAIGAAIPPRLCPASGPATIGDPACPATGHLVSITPSVAPRPSHLGLKQG